VYGILIDAKIYIKVLFDEYLFMLLSFDNM
jgi:hypothetical protein